MTLGSIDDLIAPGRREAGRRALAEAFGPGAAIVAEPLAGGASGAAVLRLEVAGGRYVLRLDAAADGLREPRRHAACLRIASEAGVAPRLLYADAASGVSITEFIEADDPADMAREARIVAAAEAVRRLHAAPPFPPLVEFMAGMAIIVGQLEAAVVLPAEEMAAVLAAWRALSDAYPRDAEVMASHNDLHPRNLLFSGGRAWIIDWELAFAADRYVDLAGLANAMGADEADAELILDRYFGRPATGAQHGRLYLMRQVSRLFYGVMMLNAAARERPGAPFATVGEGAADADSLTTYDGRVRFGRARLAEAIAGVADLRFAEAARQAAG